MSPAALLRLSIVLIGGTGRLINVLGPSSWEILWRWDHLEAGANLVGFGVLFRRLTSGRTTVGDHQESHSQRTTDRGAHDDDSHVVRRVRTRRAGTALINERIASHLDRLELLLTRKDPEGSSLTSDPIETW